MTGTDWKSHVGNIEITNVAIPDLDVPQELLDLLPDLAEQLRLNKPLSLRLSKDIPGIAIKLVKLREIFPDSNVSEMVGKR